MPSAFRTAIESADLDSALAELAEDVEYRSPAVFHPYRGKDETGLVLGAVRQAFQDFRYTSELRTGNQEILMFQARVGVRDIQGADFLTYDEDGRVTDLTVMIRPLSGLAAVVDAVGAHLRSLQASADDTP